MDNIDKLLAQFRDHEQAARAAHALEGISRIFDEIVKQAPYTLHEIAAAEECISRARTLCEQRAEELDPTPKKKARRRRSRAPEPR